MPNPVYMVYGSADEGFRFPQTENAFSSFTKAKKYIDGVVKRFGRDNVIPHRVDIEMTEEEIEGTSRPQVGETVAIYTYNGNTFAEVVQDLVSYDEETGGYDAESLYAIDWLFIVKIEVL